ncbi:MAG: hypothetical protein M3Y37_06980, partial [Chloroflexota bacterium]|nr:hypothetical protein [Chloroflexota bacterium]
RRVNVPAALITGCTPSRSYTPANLSSFQLVPIDASLLQIEPWAGGRYGGQETGEWRSIRGTHHPVITERHKVHP